MIRTLAVGSAALLVIAAIPPAHAERAFLLNGIDTKVDVSTPEKIQFVEPDIDLANIMDISDPARLRTVTKLRFR